MTTTHPPTATPDPTATDPWAAWHARNHSHPGPKRPSERARVENATIAVIARGEHPSPTRINAEMGNDRTRPNSLNGRETAHRNNLLTALGWTLSGTNDDPPEGRTWVPPTTP